MSPTVSPGFRVFGLTIGRAEAAGVLGFGTAPEMREAPERVPAERRKVVVMAED